MEDKRVVRRRERRGRVEKKSTCKQQFTRKEKVALSHTLKFNMI